MVKFKGIALAPSTVVIVVVLLVVMGVVLYFFYAGAINPMTGMVDTSKLQTECSDWRQYMYEYETFYEKVNNKEYTELPKAYSNAMEAEHYCQFSTTSLNLAGCSNSNCSGITQPTEWNECCCIDNCNSGKCGWSKSSCS
jgi:uncharacterized ion transporter superfamily protein YfcC